MEKINQIRYFLIVLKLNEIKENDTNQRFKFFPSKIVEIQRKNACLKAFTLKLFLKTSTKFNENCKSKSVEFSIWYLKIQIQTSNLNFSKCLISQFYSKFLLFFKNFFKMKACKKTFSFEFQVIWLSENVIRRLVTHFPSFR